MLEHVQRPKEDHVVTPLPNIAGAYYAQLWGSHAGHRTGITMCWKSDTILSSASADLARCTDLAGYLVSSWNTTVGPLYTSTTTGWDARVYGLGFPTNPAGVAHVNGAGANGTACEAAPAAVVVRSIVVRRGRGSQSHNALSPITKNSLTEDGTQLSPGTISDYQAQWEDFIAGVVTLAAGATTPWGASHVQLSRKGTGALWPISGYRVEALVGTERSRTARP